MYSRQKAVDYALKWALFRNPQYYSFDKIGGDCTNFVSQCLFHGGIMMNFYKYGWFYNSLNSRAPAWTGVDELFDFGVNNKSAGVRLKI